MAESGRSVQREPYHMYSVPPEAYPRYKYFRRRVLNLMERTDQLFDIFGMEKKIRQQMTEWKVQMADEVRIVVQGNDKHDIPLEHLVKKMKPVLDPVVVSTDKVRSLHNVSDVIVLPFTATTGFKEVEDTLIIRRKWVNPVLADNVIFLNMSPTSTSEEALANVERLFIRHLDGSSEQFEARSASLDELPNTISRLLEERVLHIQGRIEGTVKSCVQNASQHLRHDESMMKNTVSKLLREESYLRGWSREFKKSTETKSDTTIMQILHDNNSHTGQLLDCKVCHLVDKMCDSVGNCLESNLHNVMARSNNGFEKLLSGHLDPVANALQNLRYEVATIIVQNLQTPLDRRLGKLSIGERRQGMDSDKEPDDHKHQTQDIEPYAAEEKGESRPYLSLSEEVKIVHRLHGKAFLTRQILSIWYKTLQGLIDKADGLWKQRLKQVHWEMVGLFEESDVEEFQQKGMTDQKTIDTAKNLLLKRLKYIKGCGSCYGQLRIDVDENELKTNRSTIEKEIAECLKKLEIKDFKLVEAKEIVQFHAAGSTIQTVRGLGTLGGVGHAVFSSQRAGSEEMKMCAFVSKHLVEKCETIHVESTKQERLCLGKYLSLGENSFDIALVLIKKKISEYFEVGFKDSEGSRIINKCTVVRSASGGHRDPFRGLRKVHIWGATSRPGKGIMECSDYLRRRKVDGADASLEAANYDNEDDADMDHVLFFRDDNEKADSKFCGPGDSGAIVLAEDPEDDERLRVVAMIIGKTGESYCGFKLIDGLKSLKCVTGLDGKAVDRFIIGDDEIG